MLQDLKIYLMDLVDVFVLLFETEYVQTNYKKMINMIFAGDEPKTEKRIE